MASLSLSAKFTKLFGPTEVPPNNVKRKSCVNPNRVEKTIRFEYGLAWLSAARRVSGRVMEVLTTEPGNLRREN
jgi:hypothetical protein